MGLSKIVPFVIYSSLTNLCPLKHLGLWTSRGIQGKFARACSHVPSEDKHMDF